MHAKTISNCFFVTVIKSSHEMGCMLTIRMLTHDFRWKWVNVVMHVRQSFVCDDSEPTIVCINQVIDESEATHFKLQSQLYSSHIARSPEFLSSGGGAGGGAGGNDSAASPHTISQVQLDVDAFSTSATTQSPFTPGAGHLFFPADYAAMPGNQQHHQQQQAVSMTTKTMNSTSLMTTADSSGDSSTSDEWNITKERLKRKLAKQNQTCKAKRVRYSTTNAGRDHARSLLDDAHFMNTSATFSSGAPVGGLVGMREVPSADAMMLQQQVVDAPVYVQLKKSHLDMKLKNNDVMMMSVAPVSPHSPGPLTPDSMTSSDGSVCGGGVSHTKLSVEVPDVAMVPAGMLTPDASPMNSPAFHGSPAQCVPSIIEELEQALKQEELVASLRRPRSQEKRVKMKPVTNLPELDPLGVDSYFGTLQSCPKTSSTLLDPISSSISSSSGEAAPVTSIKQEALDDFQMAATADMQALLGDSQMASLMSSITDVAELMGDVTATMKEAELVGGASLDEQLGMSQQDILFELQQLSQLQAAASSPSYGEQHFVFQLPFKRIHYSFIPTQFSICMTYFTFVPKTHQNQTCFLNILFWCLFQVVTTSPQPFSNKTCKSCDLHNTTTYGILS